VLRGKRMTAKPTAEKRRHDGCGYYITAKGYPRFNHNGPKKGAYIHRYEAAKMLGRPLERDEDVHHRDGNKLNWSHDNLMVIGHEFHGWVSSKQRWYMNNICDRVNERFEDYVADAMAQRVEEAAIPF
jgi:hypothetical protein